MLIHVRVVKTTVSRLLADNKQAIKGYEKGSLGDTIQERLRLFHIKIYIRKLKGLKTMSIN